jgi:O-acetyl-ADP-ribose deacetylase (regulator of RNase III)
MPESSGSNNGSSRVDIIGAVQTPLGFFVLVVLVVEALLGVVAALSNSSDRTIAIGGMLFIIVGLIAVVAVLAYARPEALSGKRAAPGGATNVAGELGDEEEASAALPVPETLDEAEYQRRFEQAQEKMREIAPVEKILLDEKIGDVKFQILSGEIQSSTADFIVSSDDNRLRAKGGVAKAIMSHAGPFVLKELSQHRAYRRRQGDLVITTAGQMENRAIIHPAVIDLDYNSYPSEETIRLLVKRCLHCASFYGAKSVAFPIMGGGTGYSAELTPWDSIRAIVFQIASSFLHPDFIDGRTIEFVALYIYDERDIVGDLSELFRQATEIK